MAEVTGQLGDQEILLNNAATEITLQKILSALSAKQGGIDPATAAAVTGLGAASVAATKSNQQFGKTTKRSGADVANLGSAASKTAKNLNGGFAGAITKTIGVLGGLADGAINVVKRISTVNSTLAGLDGSLAGAGTALDTVGAQIPGIGKGLQVVAAAFGPTLASLDKTRTAFQEAAQVGANFGGNMNGVVQAAGSMGLQMSELTGIMKGNGEALMFLGGSTDAGAKRLQEFGKEFRKTSAFEDLNRLGYGTQQINEGFLKYSQLLAKGGRLQGQTDAQLRAGTYEYLKNLDAVSKLTGKTKEALQAEQDARMADAQYRTMLRSLDADGQKQLELLMQTIPKQHQQGLKEILATGTATSEEGMKAMAFLQKSGMSAQQLHQQMSATGTLTKDQVFKFNEVYQNEAKAVADSPLFKTLGKFVPEFNDLVTGVYDVAEREKSIGQIYEELETNLKTIKDNIKSGTAGTEFVDAATVEAVRNKFNEAAAFMTSELNKIDITPVNDAFDLVMKAAKEFSLPMQQKAGEYATEMGLAIAAIGGVTTALGALMTALTLAKSGLGAFTGSNRGGPGGNGAWTNQKTPSGAKPGMMGKLSSWGGKLLRVAGKAAAPVAVGMSLYDGYSRYSDADEKLASGEITQNQATVEKTKAVTSTTGGLTGMATGAMAGAAIGSAVPIVGTAIGGLIGGAIGWWAGSKAGDAVGEVIGEKLSGPDTIRDLEAKAEKLQQAIADNSFSSVGWSAEDEKQELAQIQQQLMAARQQASQQMIADGTVTEQEVQDFQTKVAEVNGGGGYSQGNITTASNTLPDAAKTEEELATGVPMTEEAQMAAATNVEKDPILELNSSIQELVALARMNNKLQQQHINVTGGLSQDAFVV